jgi:hypothetical protein
MNGALLAAADIVRNDSVLLLDEGREGTYSKAVYGNELSRCTKLWVAS